MFSLLRTCHDHTIRGRQAHTALHVYVGDRLTRHHMLYHVWMRHGLTCMFTRRNTIPTLFSFVQANGRLSLRVPLSFCEDCGRCTKNKSMPWACAVKNTTKQRKKPGLGNHEAKHRLYTLAKPFTGRPCCHAHVSLTGAFHEA